MESSPAPFWLVVTRFGEAQILLPGFLLMAGWAVSRGPAAAVSAGRWLLCLAAAALLTTATKLAFLGWGIGSPALDFTGISGHAMFAAAVLPLLFAGVAPPAQRPGAVTAAYAAAALIAVSRVTVQAHSVSESVLGFALGAAASALALRWGRPPPSRLPLLALALLVGWLALTPAAAPPSPTHQWVTRIALWLSGHPTPYAREWLHRDAAPR